MTVAAVHDDDALDDSATVTHGVSGGGYTDVSAPDLGVTVDDDETLGVVISPTAIAVQAGGSNTYTVVLGSRPAGDVTVTVTGQAGTDLELTGLSPANTLTFSTGNWHAEQEVTVGAAGDAGAAEVTLSHGVSSADDPEYAALDADDVVVTVIPMTPDTPILQLGVAVSDLKLTVPEGGTNTYTMVLSHQPTDDVTVTVNNPTDNLEVTATPRSLTFSTENWNEPQAVTVAAVHDDDALDDSATVTHGVSGGGYTDVSAPDLGVTVDDDETLGVVISPTAIAVQAGGSNTYSVVLGSQPAGDVTVTVTGQAGTDLELAGIDNDNTLTFTQDNWHAEQTVTVGAAGDAGAAEVTLSHGVSSADDPEYAAAAAPDVAVSVLEAPDTILIQLGVTTSDQELEVPEGGSNTYTMVLSHQPTDDVTVTVNNPTDNLEVTATPRSLTFSTENWNEPQAVTVAAVHDDDALDDSATVTHGVSGGGYTDVSAPDLGVTVDDDETLGVVISPTAIAVQAGGSNTYSVVLGSQPAGDVTVTVTGQAGTDLELTGLSPANTLTFSTGNWNAEQEVTVGAAGDAGAAEVTLSHGVSSADDPEYAAAAAPDVAVSVLEAPDTILIQLGVTTSDQELEVPEGGSNTYTMVLSHQPTDDVTVTVNNPTDNLEVTATPRSLTFSTENWNEPQAVTVAAVHDDDALDDSATVTHGVSGGGYTDVSAPDLGVTVDDDETLGVVISPTAIAVQAGGSNTYTVVLGSRPAGDVTVTVTGQAGTDLELTGLSPANTLTFSTGNWHAEQEVTVGAAGDAGAAEVTLSHGVSSADDPEYAALDADDVVVTVIPMTPDTPILQLGVAVSDLKLTVPEGGTNTYTMVLSHQPTDDVTVTVNNPTDNLEVTATPRSLTFSTENWNEPQAVTVAAVHDDDALDDSATVTHGVSGGGYTDVSAPDLGVTVDDDETLGVVISPTAIAVQAGGSNTYSVVLGSQPAGDVTVTVTGQAGTDLELAGIDNDNTLTFTQDNWHAEQTVTVGAAGDAGAAEVTLSHGVSSADDPEYAAAAAPDVAVSVLEAPDTILIQLGVTTSDQELEVPEGGSNTYTMVLSHQPTDDVTVTVNNPTDNLEVTATPRSLTFSTENWNEPQAVTVAAVHDDDALDDSATVTHGVSGGGYTDVSAPDLGVTVDDDETLGVVISPTAIAVQAGGSNTYSVVLGSQPAGDVTVTVTGQAGTDLELTGLSPANTLTFSTGNWNAEQEVTVGAAGDAGAAEVTLSHGVSSADDPEYAAAAAPDVAVSVLEAPDTILIQLGVTTSDQELEVPEGGSNTYTMVLSHQPTDDVTVTVNNPTDNLEVTATPRSLTFSTENWNEPQAVTVAAVHDDDALDDSATVTHGVSGGGYTDVSAPDLGVTVDDDETLGVVISPTAIAVQAGGSNTYTVVLGSRPAGDVTVTVTGQAGTDLELTGLSPANTLTFSTGNWHAEQEVTVGAAGDAGAAEVTLSHGVSSADDPEYAALDADDVVVTVIPMTPDTPILQLGVAVSDLKLTVPEGGTNTYTMVLSHQPTDDVTVTVNNPTDNLEVTATPRSLTFSTENWNEPQAVTVAAVHDDDALDDSATVTHGVSGGGYTDVSAPDLGVTVDDDETLGVVISPTAIAVQAGGSNTYSVVLGSQPAGDVTVTVTGQAGTDLELAGIDNDNTLTFTQDNWHAEQTVTVGAAGDAGAAEVTLSHGVSSADDPEYAAAAAPDVAVSVLEAPDTILIQLGVTTSDQELEVPEGGSNTYTMVLSHQPTDDVTVTVNNPTDNLEVTATPRSLTFSTENWNEPQAVTVAAVHDDDALDDSATVTHGVSGGGYTDVSAPDLGVTVDDDETLGVVISPTAIAVQAGGSNTYSVVLGSQPAGDVTVTVTGQAGTDLELTGLSPANTLTFSTGNWNAEQEVTVGAAGDAGAAEVTLSHGVSSADDPEYAAAAAPDVAVSVLEAPDTILIQLGVTTSDQELEVPEGGSNTYTMVLSHQPTDDVTVTVNNPTDNLEVTATPRSLTFSTENWNEPQAVTVAAVHDDDALDDSATVTHGVSGGGYTDVSAPDLGVTVDDDETLGVVISPTAIAVQAGGSNTYTVVLGSRPAGDVTVTVTGQAGTDLELTGLSPANTLTFSTGNWHAEQEVTVGAAGDAGAAEVTLSHGVSSADDPEYAALDADDVVVTVIPMTPDTPILQLGVAVSDLKLTVPEGGTNTYTMVLSHQPTDDVTVTVNNPTDNLEVTATPRSLTFSTENWNEPQAVTVAAVHDDDALDDSATVTHGVSGGGYTDVSAPDLGVTVDDDETLGVVISPTAIAVQAGGSNTYSVVLGSQPAGDVTVTVTGQAGTDLELAGIDNDNTLTFTQDNWHAEQTVTVGAAGDAGAAEVTLSHGVSSADDPEYAAAAAPDVAVSVLEAPDTILIQLGVTTSDQELEVPEGGSNTYTMVLSHQPTDDVTVTVNNPTDNLEVTATPRSLTFSTENWNEPQAVTVAAVHDDDALDDSATVTHGVSGGGYTDVSAPDLGVTVDDDETLGVVISPTAIAVQAGGSNTYSVVLGSQPAGDVTVTVTGQAGTDLELTGLSPANTLTFSTGNWNAEQEVTVGAAGDAGAAEVTLSHGVSSADDPEYAAAAAPDVAVSVLEAPDTILIQLGVTTSDQELEVPEGGSNTYTMVLSHQPTDDVTVTVNNPTDNLEVTATPRSLTFSTENWNEPQAVTVAAVHDDDALDDSATVTHGVSGGGYTDVSAPDLGVTVDDDETLGVVISPTAIAVQAGGSNTYTVVLGSRPAGDVTVTVTGQAGTDLELTGLSPANTLTFSTGNWHAEQEVTVGAAGDAGAAEVTLSHGVSSADDPEYAALDADDVVVTVIPMTPDTPILQLGVAVSDLKLTVPEGGTKTYTMVLSHQPTDDVTVTVNNPTDNLEVTATPRSLTFSTENWNEPQAVTVAAVHDDDALDDSATVTHGVSGGGYTDVSAPDLGVTVDDDETLGVVISPTAIAVQAGGSNTYSVVLGSQPAGDVTVTVTGQAGTDLELAGIDNDNTLTFTQDNWHAEQTVTVGAAGDAGAAEVTLSHGVSSADDPEYAAAAAPDVAVSVLEAPDTILIQLGVTTSDQELEVPEGGSNTYTMVLSHQPTDDVTVTVNNPTDNLEVTATPRSLTFSTENWNEPQAVTVAAVHDDDALDDSATVTHGVSGGGYTDVSAPDLGVTVDDDETLGVVISPTAIAVQAGGSNTYSVVLGSQPAGDVTVTVTGQAGTDLELTGLSPANTLTFSTGNWNAEQEVTVGAAGDAGAAEVTLSHGVSSADDPEYAAAAPDVAVSVLEAPDTILIQLGVTTSDQELEVPEGGSNTYTMVLSHQPTDDVTVTVNNPTDNLEVTATPRSLTFSTENWNEPQAVTVAAVHDDDALDDSATVTPRRQRRRLHRCKRPGPGGDGGRRRDPRGGHQPHGHRRPGRRQQHLHRGPGVPARGGRDGHGDGPGRHGPGADRAEPREHADLQHRELERGAGGDGRGRRGCRRCGGHPVPRGQQRRRPGVRRARCGRCGSDRDPHDAGHPHPATWGGGV